MRIASNLQVLRSDLSKYFPSAEKDLVEKETSTHKNVPSASILTTPSDAVATVQDTQDMQNNKNVQDSKDIISKDALNQDQLNQDRVNETLSNETQIFNLRSFLLVPVIS